MRNLHTRRHWLGAAASSYACFAGAAFGAADFWNTKDPPDWSTVEVLQLTTRSPWAKPAHVQFKARGRSNGLRSEIGSGRGGRGEPGPLPPPPEIQGIEVIVRWESARPLLDAVKFRMPPDFADRYVIGIGELPATRGQDSPEDFLNQLKSGATLQTKAKDPVGAGVIQRARGASAVLFGFSKELLLIGPGDKDVLFSLTTEQFALKAKFDPKEMVYRGQLAL